MRAAAFLALRRGQSYQTGDSEHVAQLAAMQQRGKIDGATCRRETVESGLQPRQTIGGGMQAIGVADDTDVRRHQSAQRLAQLHRFEWRQAAGGRRAAPRLGCRLG